MPHWRNWIARQTSNLKVVGSSPTWGILFTSLNGKAIIQIG